MGGREIAKRSSQMDHGAGADAGVASRLTPLLCPALPNGVIDVNLYGMITCHLNVPLRDSYNLPIIVSLPDQMFEEVEGKRSVFYSSK
jgi:hypothetical protein